MVLLGVLLGVSIAVITHHYQKQLRGKGFFHLTTLRLYSITEPCQTGAQGKNLAEETDAETIEYCCLLACCSQLASSAFL